MVGLGDLPGNIVNGRALAVSGDGSIIVGTSASAIGDHEAFIWDEAHGMRNLRELLVNDYGLDLAGWILRAATGISDDGTVIVGWGRAPTGNQTGWVAYIPEPATVFLLIFGALIVVRMRPRKCLGYRRDASG